MAQGTTTQALRPGTKLRSKERVYEIVEVLGSGSFGITYKATAEVSVGNITTTMKFAIKEHFMSASCYRGDDGVTVLTVPTAKSDVVDSRSDFITEANRLKKLCLKSRNIVSVNETFEANGTAYYVMEFLDGGSPSKCSEEEAISIVKQIANALDEIHKEMVLHLDIKPDNIVLKTNDRGETYPVLIDFGISKHFDSKGRPTSSLSAKGASPGYAPQEQYAGVNEFSTKYDIYALGAVLFFLCTGKNPPDAFKISPNQQELKSQINGIVSEKVEKTIQNAMKPSAMERTPSIKQFCDDLMGVNFVPALNISDSRARFSKEKEQRNITVDSNINWTVYSDKDWCKVSRRGNDIVISVPRNKETGDRQCNIVINGATYQVSQTILVTQKGQGTIVFPKDSTWWERHNRKVYLASGVVLAGCFIAGLCMLLKPDPEKESRRLTESITAMDGTELKRYAELDSVGAYLPYARFLFQNEDYENAAIYADKAIDSDGSVDATNLLSEIIEQNSPAQESEAREETDDVKFARASNDFNLMRSLAQDKYVKAYYPLAMMYYQRDDTKNAKFWAQNSINAKVNQSKAKSLLKKINDSSPVVSQSHSSLEQPSQSVGSNSQEQDKRLQEALKDPFRGAATLIILAELEHYSPAYYHYARQLLQQGKTLHAKEFLKMSIEKGVNVSQSKQLLETLEE